MSCELWMLTLHDTDSEWHSIIGIFASRETAQNAGITGDEWSLSWKTDNESEVFHGFYYFSIRSFVLNVPKPIIKNDTWSRPGDNRTRMRPDLVDMDTEALLFE